MVGFYLEAAESDDAIESSLKHLRWSQVMSYYIKSQSSSKSLFIVQVECLVVTRVNFESESQSLDS